jgi:DNA-binding transcriptional ArsR family regulator
MHSVSEKVVGILPVFRSETQMRLLAELFSADRPEASVVEVARRAGVQPTTASRELSRLEDYGVVTSRLLGRARLVRAAWEQPWAPDLAALLAKTVGVPAQLAAALSAVEGVEAAFIFGSWAARYHGEPGPAPRDIDVVVIGDADVYAVRRAFRPLEKDLRLEINPVVVAGGRWDNPEPEDALLDTMKDRPLVPLPVRAA